MPPKRKSTEADREDAVEEQPQQSAVPEIDSDDERLDYITDNCDQIRRKIAAFIENGDMKVGEFQDAIGVSPRSYSAFLGQGGRAKGSESLTYINAARFFKKRELQGFKPPRKKVKKAVANGSDKENRFDVSGVSLPGDEEAEVPVFETCDVIRRKIRAHMREPQVTQAGFLRELTKAAYPNGQNKPNSRSMNDFLSKKGPRAGDKSSLFYGGYVYFEKLRVKEGKPKSKFREEMEDVWKSRGMNLEHSSSYGYWCGTNETAVEDKYGMNWDL